MPLDLFSDWKAILGAIASVVIILSFIPYIIAIFKRQTEPHAYTWLIWCITLATAGAGVWFGEGGIWVTIGFGLSTLLCMFIFLLSFKYGTKNITLSDTVILALALIATFFWWGLDNPVLAVVMATVIDFLAYIPTYRKSLAEPWSEDLLAWFGYALVPLLSLFALYEYNWLTTTYDVVTLLANGTMVALLMIRRQTIKKPA